MVKQQSSFDEKKKKLTALVVAMLICILACIIVAASMFGLTFARYATSGSGTDKSIEIAKWGVTTDVTGTLTLDSNTDVVAGKIAPGSTGYIDVRIKLEGTEVSVDYTLTIGSISIADSGSVPSTLKIKEVKAGKDVGTLTLLSEGSHAEADGSGTYKGTIQLEGSAMTSDFIVRIYVEWADGSPDQNTTDTALGDGEHSVKFNIKVDAEQHIASEAA